MPARVVKLIVSLAGEVECVNEWNVSHLTNLVYQNLVLQTVLLQSLTDTLATYRRTVTD